MNDLPRQKLHELIVEYGRLLLLLLFVESRELSKCSSISWVISNIGFCAFSKFSVIMRLLLRTGASLLSQVLCFM
jgi:hypothetical protein